MKKILSNLDTYTIVFFVLILAAISTYFVPVGQYQVNEIEYTDGLNTHTKKIIDPSTFTFVKDSNGNKLRKGVTLFEAEGSGKQGFFNSIFDGLTSGDKWSAAVGVIAFLLIIGGAFGIIISTGSIEVILMQVITKLKNYSWLVISVLFVLFSLGGAIFGMSEETIPFLLLMLPMFIRMGLDSITALLTIFIATQIGFAASWMNPFSVAIAQGIANVPILSGSVFRIIMWFVLTTFGLLYTLNYARKVKKNPNSSITFETDKKFVSELSEESKELKLGHVLVVLTLALGISWIVWGVIVMKYYIPEIATQFFIIGFVSGIIAIIFKLNKMSFSSMASSFREGAAGLLPAAIVVGLAKGIVILLGGDNPESASVLNTILYYSGALIKDLPTMFSAWFMYIFQTIMNFFVVSGSGQAALTMPIMAPLSDIVGVNRQIAVLAFQLGDGFTNMVVPTSAILMALLGIAKVEWLKWFKFQFKFQLSLFVFASLFIAIAVLTNYS